MRIIPINFHLYATLKRIAFLLSALLLFTLTETFAQADIRPVNDSIPVTIADLNKTRELSKGKFLTGAAYVALYYNLNIIPDVEWLYSTITVPAGETPLYTYYCVLNGPGFYTGLQVNSKKERQVIFSVWDYNHGNNKEKLVAAEDRADIIKSGANVVSRRFENEGSGVHTHLVNNWRDDTTYRFLVHIQPDTFTNSTLYTLFISSGSKWELIAQINRPKSKTSPEYAASFVEDWTKRGDRYRRAAYFENQWVCTSKGEWRPMPQALFYLPFTDGGRTVKDYGGGLSPNNGYLLVTGGGCASYYLENNTILKRKVGDKPVLDLTSLP